jgi:hypothetical protein
MPGLWCGHAGGSQPGSHRFRPGPRRDPVGVGRAPADVLRRYAGVHARGHGGASQPGWLPLCSIGRAGAMVPGPSGYRAGRAGDRAAGPAPPADRGVLGRLSVRAQCLSWARVGFSTRLPSSSSSIADGERAHGQIDLLVAPFGRDPGQRRRIRAVISFWTWRSLCAEQGLADQEAVEVMTSAVQAAMASPATAPAPSHAWNPGD